MRIYISGPITGNPGYKEQFEEAARWVEGQGYVPVNPVEIDPGCLGECTRDREGYDGKPHTWGCYLKYDLAVMLTCDIVYVLPGWESSRGAQLEIGVARNCDMPVVYQEGGEDGQGNPEVG